MPRRETEQKMAQLVDRVIRIFECVHPRFAAVPLEEVPHVLTLDSKTSEQSDVRLEHR